MIRSGDGVLIILDSNHTKRHVQQELKPITLWCRSYLVATDGACASHDVPRGKPEWRWDNPAAAASEFAQRHPEFVLEQPAWPFNESELSENITHWPDAWLRRR
jgi:cephalosporin hydroxylase